MICACQRYNKRRLAYDDDDYGDNDVISQEELDVIRGTAHL